MMPEKKEAGANEKQRETTEASGASDTSSKDSDESRDEKGEEGRKQLKQIVDGTARIGKSIGEAFKGVAHIFQGRDYVVMVRVNGESLSKIDQLIDSGIFRSRSESAAYLIARGIQADGELFSKLEQKLGEINKLREELHRMVGLGPHER